MNFAKSLTITVTLLITFGCEPEESAPIEPYIESVKFYHDFDKTLKKDTINLTINFRDGDFDLGLDPSDPAHQAPPFHAINYFQLKNGKLIPRPQSYNVDLMSEIVKLEDSGKFVTYQIAQTQLDTPEPYSCASYRESEVLIDRIPDQNNLTIDDTIIYHGEPLYHVRDTFLFERNPNHYNLHVDFLVEANGTFEKVDWEKSICGTFDARFTPMDGLAPGATTNAFVFLLNRLSETRGQIGYNIAPNYPLFHNTFQGQRLKARVTIVDRALHISNEVESDPILIK
jgi:hypothetical protein